MAQRHPVGTNRLPNKQRNMAEPGITLNVKNRGRYIKVFLSPNVDKFLNAIMDQNKKSVLTGANKIYWIPHNIKLSRDMQV